MKTKKPIILLSLFFVLTSCSMIMSKLYGVKKITYFDQAKHNQFIKDLKKKIPVIDIVSDTLQYKKTISLGKTRQHKKNLGQPIQMLYFTKGKTTRKLESFHANCFAKGNLTSIDWNTDGRFDKYLPKSAIDVNEMNLSLSDYAKIYSKINAKSDKETTIIVFWTFFLEKFSSAAINTMISNLKEHNKIDEVDIYLINLDKNFIVKN